MKGKKRVLVVFRGIAVDSDGYRGSRVDCRRTCANAVDMIVRSLREDAGHDVCVGLSTYETPDLQDVRRRFEMADGDRQLAFCEAFRDGWKNHPKTDCIIRALEEALERREALKLDAVVVARLDLLFRRPIAEFQGLDLDRVCFLWRETFAKLAKRGAAAAGAQWKSHRRVSDALLVFPISDVPVAIEALKKIREDIVRRRDADNCHKILHHMRTPDKRISFLVPDGFYDSNSKAMRNPVYFEAVAPPDMR